ncbi:hypothetical protein TrLO_g6822 [Triparma laevis f. longispina]|uniref:Uncharacterized protein n=1 Tax=Triparma laevis f. longispina TaxID=1714387 RepID=A0A9W7FBZ9_9STRA|nr:hypothetical protein TrLO_g6822 [Triparma laevis f. longispina]
MSASLNAVVVGAPPRINMSRPMLSLSQSTEIKILAIPEGPAGRSGCCWGTKRIWDDSEIEYLYVRENSVEIFSPIHNKRCCSSAFHSSADVLYFDSPWTLRPAGSVSALRGFFCGDDGEKIVFEYCPWFCVCCERKREVGVLDGVATVQLIEKIRGEARKRMNMER